MTSILNQIRHIRIHTAAQCSARLVQYKVTKVIWRRFHERIVICRALNSSSGHVYLSTSAKPNESLCFVQVYPSYPYLEVLKYPTAAERHRIIEKTTAVTKKDHFRIKITKKDHFL